MCSVTRHCQDSIKIKIFRTEIIKINIKMIYLDHAAATPMSKKVFEASLPYFSEEFFYIRELLPGNPGVWDVWG